jgi:hypothetical protein
MEVVVKKKKKKEEVVWFYCKQIVKIRETPNCTVWYRVLYMQQ